MSSSQNYDSLRVFFVKASSGTGQFARLISAASSLIGSSQVCWISPPIKEQLPRIIYFSNLMETKDLLKEYKQINLIFSSETDIVKNLFSILKIKYFSKSMNLIFLQRIDSLKNYLFNYKKSLSLSILIRVISFPFMLILSSFLIDKYVFQTPFASKDYFLKKNILSIVICIFSSSKVKIEILPNNTGTDWNKSFYKRSWSF